MPSHPHLANIGKKEQGSFVGETHICSEAVTGQCRNITIGLFQAATKKQKYERISEKKMSTAVDVLCKVSVQAALFLIL